MKENQKGIIGRALNVMKQFRSHHTGAYAAQAAYFLYYL